MSDFHPERQYQQLLADLILMGDRREGRNGETASLFGAQMRFDLQAGFPLLTTKRVHLKSIIAELLWMLAGQTNVKTLQAQGVTIWDEWADEDGELGPVYGSQWRSWSHGWTHPVDQIAALIHGLRTDPYGRRHLVTAWQPLDLPHMALPPCHCLFQFHVARGRLNCHLYQRSADWFLGVPFNIASYSLLTMMVAQVVGLQPGEFIHSFGDYHLYTNHEGQAVEQIRRRPKPFPRMLIDPQAELEDYRIEHFHLTDYDPWPALPAVVSR